MTASTMAEQLENAGVCIYRDFLSPDELSVLRKRFDDCRHKGLFRPAGVGQGTNFQRALGIRRDQILWLERNEEDSSPALLWGKIEELQSAFNRTLFLGLKSFEGHYAYYPPGGFYRRHRDTFRGDSGRIVSLIIYLNAAWLPSHGGQLRVYSASSYRDIEPKGGTLVCFLSQDIEHEVLPALEPRMSFTGWFKG